MANKIKSALVGIALLLGFSILGCAEDTAYQAVGPFGPLNNKDNPIIIPYNMAQDLLNVDISPEGKSIKKREGYGLSSTLGITTSAVHGIYTFFDASGNEVSLYANDKRLTSQTNNGSLVLLVSSYTLGATWQCTDSQGFAYCLNSYRDPLVKTNGATWNQIVTPATGTMVTVTPERLVTAGFAEAPNRVDFSKANDFATWTVGANATDPINFTITAPGSRITHITYAFGRIMWFKNTSFGYILMGNQPAFSDWQIVTVSPNIGAIDNTSIYWNGVLYFKGNDGHFYSFDGTNLSRLSRDIEGTVRNVLNRSQSAWIQTSQSDWETGTSTNVSTSLSPGSIVLSTQAAISEFVDTSSSDFTSGTCTNVDTTTTLGSVTLAYTTTQLNTYTDISPLNADYHSNDGSVAQKFTALGDELVDSVQLYLTKGGSGSTNVVYLKSDSGGSPGSPLMYVNYSFSSIPAGPTYVDVPFGATYKLASGTAYWIEVARNGGPSYVAWNACDTDAGSCSAALGDSYTESDARKNTTKRFIFKLDGLQYSASGSLVSRAFDMGTTTNSWTWNWGVLSATETIPTNTTLTYQIQASSSSTGGWTSLESVVNGSTITTTSTNRRRYLRYKASLATSKVYSTPQLDSVSINSSAMIRSTGTYYSAVKYAPSLTSFDSFVPIKNDNEGTHTFYIRTATNPIPINSSTYTWVAINAGAIPSSTGTYFQIRDDFSVTNATQNPTLDSFTQYWFEGGADDKTYATVFKDHLWWSVAYGTSTTNNRVLKYDINEPGWTIYDVPSNGFLVKNNAVYFGSTSAGKIYKYGDTNSDDTSAINAYWQSKDFVADSPFTDKEFTSISFIANSVLNSTVTVTYTINGYSETSFNSYIYRANADYKKINKNLPAGKVGNSISLKFGNNAADQPFEIFGSQIGLRPKPWNVEQ